MSLPFRSHPRPRALAPPGTAAFDDQRLLLLELLVDPPPEGDAVAELAAALGRPERSVVAAASVLARVGLAERRGRRIRASPSALAFDALWPVCL
jgi:DNA-binding IclR family transcriptional regulator